MKVVTESDLKALEELLEQVISPALKEYLLDIYGEGGERSQALAEAENRKSACPKDCYWCGQCNPYIQHDLLYLLLKDIKHFNELER